MTDVALKKFMELVTNALAGSDCLAVIYQRFYSAVRVALTEKISARVN